jgi:hypothetical protein
LPDCRQISDKFHLMQNLINAIREILRGEMPREGIHKGRSNKEERGKIRQTRW